MPLRFVLSLLLIVLTVAVYQPVRAFEFVNFDDPEYVTNNRHVATGLSWENAAWATTTSYAANWFPLTWLSLMTDASIWGVDAGGFHLTNLLLHVANVVVLFLLLAEITGALGPSAFVAALFAIHPLHVESVAWVTERKDVLSTFFGLLAIGTFCRYGRSGHRGAYVASLVLFAASLMSKQMLVTLPLLLLLLDVWPLRRWMSRSLSQEVRRGLEASNAATLPLPLPEREGGADAAAVSVQQLVLEKIPYFALAGIAVLIVVMVQQHGGAVQTLAQVPLERRLANAIVVYVLYLAQTVWPGNLAAFYPFPVEGIATFHVVVAAVILIGVTAVAIAQAKRRPYFLVGWLWYVVTLAPVIGIVQVGSQRMADRYTYVPLIGIFVAVSWLAVEIVPAGPWRRFLLPGASLAIVGGLAVAAAFQVRCWSDSVTLFERALAMTTNNSVAHTNLGLAKHDLGQSDEAIRHFRAALEIDPNHAIAHNNLGVELLARGDKEKAHEHFATAVSIDPRYATARINLANALRDRGETQAAIDEYRRALDVDSDNANAIVNLSEVLRATNKLDDLNEAISLLEKACALDRNNATAQMNLGLAYHSAGRVDDAIYHFERAVALDDDYAAAHVNLGAALSTRHELEKAANHFRRALEIDPNHAQAKMNLTITLLQLGTAAAGPGSNDIGRAIGYFREAATLTPENWQAHFNLAIALQIQGSTDEAEKHFHETLKLRPNSPDAHNALGAILLQHGKRDAAIEHFREALRLKPDFPPAQKNLNDALDASKQKK
ncbi:MAG: tetratricopeptide repeat protein [Planctomycetaceae bacterium]